MWAVAASAAVEIFLTMARAAVLTTGASGTHAGTLAVTAIAALQGIAATCSIGALAAGPVVMLLAARCQAYLAHRRLPPLWAAMKEAVPDVELPVRKRAGFGIQWRLLRRVIEIHDAEQALSPYWNKDIAARAQAAAQSAMLSADQEQAVIEAAVIMNAARTRLRGEPPATEPLPGDQLCGSTGDDLHYEVERLLLVSQAIRQFPIVYELNVDPETRE
jgi:hypothetical protein